MNISDAKLKSWIAFIMRNKTEIGTLLDYFDPRDIENGILTIPESFINSGLKMRIMDHLQDYVDDYRIAFENNRIYLHLKLHLKQIGPIEAKYLIGITDFRFSDDCRRIYGTFQEEVKSLGNMLQAMALKAACSNSTCLQKALRFTNCDFIFVDGNRIMIDLDRFELAQKVPSNLELNYVECDNGYLKLNFNY
ncbi:hypothetical protein [Clostridium aminobutyricum]|uniref:Uncharacterized protein n=1 Tax=Clostridium aminobutyricum TaxID=33953 RepID=A0A939D8C5_CLOAM|nr:hypothetical protein [Clostridium aminobutyricum]MBN7772942.1 hypothetical protein [Clostridium aminobutyricum]